MPGSSAGLPARAPPCTGTIAASFSGPGTLPVPTALPCPVRPFPAVPIAVPNLPACRRLSLAVWLAEPPLSAQHLLKCLPGPCAPTCPRVLAVSVLPWCLSHRGINLAVGSWQPMARAGTIPAPFAPL